MRRTKLALYVSAQGWVAAPCTDTPVSVSGVYADLSEADWPAIGEEVRQSFGPARVRLVLSALRCQFLVLPWVSSCRMPADVRAFVAEAFAETAAVVADTHRIEIDWPRYGEPIVAAAYPRLLIEAVREGLLSSGLVLDEVSSSVDGMLARYGRALGTGASLLAYAEDDGLTAVSIDGGRVVQIETLSWESDGLQQVEAWATRKQFAFADDSQLYWLGSSAKPPAYVGTVLDSAFVDVASPGHAVVFACR